MPELQWHEHHGVAQDRGLMSFAHHHVTQPDGVMVLVKSPRNHLANPIKCGKQGVLLQVTDMLDAPVRRGTRVTLRWALDIGDADA